MSEWPIWNEDGPECPYCNHVNATTDAELLRRDAAIKGCQKCGQFFAVEVSLHPEWCSSKIHPKT